MRPTLSTHFPRLAPPKKLTARTELIEANAIALYCAAMGADLDSLPRGWPQTTILDDATVLQIGAAQ